MAGKYLTQSKPRNFTDGYREDCFYQWYGMGKPSTLHFMGQINPDKNGFTPSRATLDNWSHSWRERALVLDEQVLKELEARMVAEKVEMLKRHADIGKEIQDIAIEYLEDEDNLKKITPPVAVRLLVEGVKIERSSRGMPNVLEEVMNKSDQELLEDIASLFEKTNMETLEDDEGSTNKLLPNLQK